jgi:serine/threonine protein kinase
VESLLSFDQEEGQALFDRPALGEDFVLPKAPEQCSDTRTLEMPVGATATLPRHIGPYSVLEELGHGGMGVVYLAEQTLTQRRVAIKVLRTRAHSSSRLQRFEREAQILGLLKHPGIAQIYEAGTADFGAGAQMFFAMELVDGPPITEFAEQRSLSVAARIELWAQVCDAVQHAHGRSVLHRDLKPDNVLVDESGAPKVLDFGVARFDEGARDRDTSNFEHGQLVGTPAYMSPEQLAGATDDLDVRSDVYALGVMGHELLTGVLPSKAGAISAEHELGGELEVLLSTALAATPDDRYSSAGNLAADLRRYLAHEPLHAREASAGYILRKFAQRRRALTLALTSLFLLLIVGIAVTSLLALEARRQANRHQKLSGFLQEVLESPNPMELGSDVTVLEVLANSEDMIRRQLAGEPEVEAEVRMTLGIVYRQLGNLRRAEPHLRNAVELFRQTAGERDLRTKQAKIELANLLLLYSESDDEAELLLRDLLESAGEKSSVDRMLHVRTLYLSASIRRKRGDFDGAVLDYKRAEELVQPMRQDDLEQTLLIRSFRARALGEGRRYREAEELARATLLRHMSGPGEGHRSTLVAQTTLGWVLLRRSQTENEPVWLAEAETVMRSALEGRTTLLGPDHPGTLTARQWLSEIVEGQGKMVEALVLQREVLEGFRRSMGLDRPDAEQAFERLEMLLVNADQGEEARQLRVDFERERDGRKKR